jgi:RNA ligase (TIGR02306 family)
MSSLIIEVCRVDKVEAHPNADKMAVATIKGWKTCIRKNDDGSTQFTEGDLCLFVPPDAVLPKELSDRLGVTNYLKQLAKKADGTRPEGGRVAVSRLRGQPSYGFITSLEILNSYYTGHGEPYVWKLGDDVAGLLGITKWEPPITCTDGDAERPHPAFHKYFDLENYRNFPDLIPDGESVVFTEKLHGKNCRVAYIRDTGDDGEMKWTWMAGSHDVRRKESVTRKRKTYDKDTKELKVEEYQDKPQFWQALDKPGVRDMIAAISDSVHNVVCFGEIFGSGVQDMTYGMEGGKWDFRVFDIAVNGKYMAADTKYEWCRKFGVQTVPILYDGPFSKAKVEEFVTGNTTVCAAEQAGAFKGREGIVITAKTEKTVTTEKKVFDRMALKAINFDYLERKNGTEFH